MEKITYASLGSLGAEFHRAFDDALGEVRVKLGGSYPLYIGGKPKIAKGGAFADTSPADTRVVLGNFMREQSQTNIRRH